MLRVGQKVVCVQKSPQGTFKKGKVYTVAKISHCECGMVALHMAEFPAPMASTTTCYICNRRLPLVHYIGSAAHRFRPLETTYTESEIESVDISEITQEEVITV